MPDPWEYPWFAAWDPRVSHCYLGCILIRRSPNISCWCCCGNGSSIQTARSRRTNGVSTTSILRSTLWPRSGCSSLTVARISTFCERIFQKLLLNFTWWLNREDPEGNNIFGGGFLGLDNISPIDRSHLPPGVRLDQADGTAWMAYYSVAMLALAVLLAERDSVYEDMVAKFLEQLVLVMDALEDLGCYDPSDGFFYDLLTDAFGNREPIKVQTLVGVIPRPARNDAANSKY